MIKVMLDFSNSVVFTYQGIVELFPFSKSVERGNQSSNCVKYFCAWSHNIFNWVSK